MSLERLETLADPSKAPLKYSQHHWHILAYESGSWPPVFYLQPCLPSQVHFNWHELLKHWMPLSAFLKGNRYIKYIRLQVFKIKCYKHRLNYMLFIPLRNSRSWHSVLSFQNNFYLHLHLEAFKTQQRVNAFGDITGNRELRWWWRDQGSASQTQLPPKGNRGNTEGRWARSGQGCAGPSAGYQRGPQQWGKVISAQPLLKTKNLTFRKNNKETIALISVSMMSGKTVWSPSWEEAWLLVFSVRLPWWKGTEGDK